MARTGLTVTLDTSSIDTMIERAKAIISADESRLPELQAIFDDEDLFGRAKFVSGVLSFAPSERMQAFLDR